MVADNWCEDLVVKLVEEGSRQRLEHLRCETTHRTATLVTKHMLGPVQIVAASQTTTPGEQTNHIRNLPAHSQPA